MVHQKLSSQRIAEVQQVLAAYTPAIPGTDLAQTADQTPDPTQESLITLTTCHPQFSNAERMIVHGMLTEQIPKDSSGTRPAVLEES